LQRLYSTFANGWPGIGLLIQRVACAIVLVRFCVIHLTDSPFSIPVIPHIVGACAAVLFLVGLWTPFVGTLIAVSELLIAVTHTGDPWVSIMLATFGGTSAMLGPGAFSIDARLFGRRHLRV
jgi:putative oxidoreductase